MNGRLFLYSLAAVAAVAGCDAQNLADVERSQPAFASIDIHTHTNLTDGTHTQADVANEAIAVFGLDMFANSEHGGLSAKDATGAPYADGLAIGDTADSSNKPIRDAWAEAAPGPYVTKTTNQVWRWQVLRDISWPIVKALNADATIGGRIVQGVEWNVPTHEHASVGVVGVTNGKAIADFEFMFDGSDKDNSRNGTRTNLVTAGGTSPTTSAIAAEVDLFGNALSKKYKTHSDSVAGAAYLQKNFKDTSYLVINHPSRSQGYTAADLRDFMVAAPDVAVGLEGFPGHQKEPCRGGYDRMYDANGVKVSNPASADSARTARARTFGGADWMLAKVGGTMDSFWAEGRKFWVFVNSDFHTYAANADFWPGQYARTWVGATSKTQADIVKGMKAGNLFAVQGDLIDALDFRVKGYVASAAQRQSAFAGESVTFSIGQEVEVEIRIHSPGANAHGDAVKVDHVDVIAGSLKSKSSPGDSGYTGETSDATVVARIPASSFVADGDFLKASVTIPLDKSKFVRIRGTNLAVPTSDSNPDIDIDGNPKQDEPTDSSLCANTEAKAWADLWFYSNPIFMTAK